MRRRSFKKMWMREAIFPVLSLAPEHIAGSCSAAASPVCLSYHPLSHPNTHADIHPAIHTSTQRFSQSFSPPAIYLACNLPDCLPAFPLSCLPDLDKRTPHWTHTLRLAVVMAFVLLLHDNTTLVKLLPPSSFLPSVFFFLSCISSLFVLLIIVHFYFAVLS